eukprot:CAMPEP_0175024820 /NCGR_PEP_ID=MMETSP0005-20121125/16704_1 /TAXON_ID=420556 /ORGANISM="Ochromonas sp., Strain CCMP1393" /LENGTH=446 /DNA_ID=CAMNT_0016283465 /DNA_START=95 /DNA_END=1435 /DNA_ORIENTATION=-
MSKLNRCPCCPDVIAPEGYNFEPTPGLTEEESTFNDAKHMDLGYPDTIKKLDTDMQNRPEMVEQLATNYGCCSSFKVLSDEGVRVLTKVLAGVEKHSVTTPRIPKVLRGSTFYSKFLHGMAHSEAILRHVSDLAGCEMIHHPIRTHHLHVNFKPKSTGGEPKNIDRWHCDTTPFVLVLFATDPDEYEGGRLEYYNGAREEATAYFKKGEPLPSEKVLNVGRQHQGYGVLLQGWRVFHQVTPVLRGDNRTTLVYSFHPRNVLGLEACTRFMKTYNLVDPLHIFGTDWCRYRAWKVLRRFEIMKEKLADLLQASSVFVPLLDAVEKSSKKLCKIIQTLPYVFDRQLIAIVMRDAISDVRACLGNILCRNVVDEPSSKRARLANTPTVVDSEFSTQVIISDIDKAIFGNDEFNSSPYGLVNVKGAILEIDNCIDDVLSMNEGTSDMEFF